MKGDDNMFKWLNLSKKEKKEDDKNTKAMKELYKENEKLLKELYKKAEAS